MLLDKVSEEYPQIELHYHLFSVNQLLYKAYNGKFPNTKAMVLDFSLISSDKELTLTKEVVLKSLDKGLSERNLIKRLYSDEMSSPKHFPDAEKILWEFHEIDAKNYRLMTSEYWLGMDDIVTTAYSCEVEVEEILEED